MLFGPERCSNPAVNLCILYLILFHCVLALPTTNQPNTTPKKNASKTSGKVSSTRKPHQKPKAQRQKPKEPDPDDYYEDASEMEDPLAVYFHESPYEGIDYRKQLIKHNIVPDFLHMIPLYPLEVYYRNDVVKYGNMLSYNETKIEPRIIKWHNDPKKYYTLILTDPDAPLATARDHEEEWHHWLVTNILSHHINIGDVYAEYLGIIPSRGEHIHRYVFLIYEQPGDDAIDFDEIHLGPEPIDMLRGYFSAKEFAKRYNLTGPVACNFFLGDWSKAPPVKLSTEEPKTFQPGDVHDQKCHMGEDPEDPQTPHPYYNQDDSDIHPDIHDLYVQQNSKKKA